MTESRQSSNMAKNLKMSNVFDKSWEPAVSVTVSLFVTVFVAVSVSVTVFVFAFVFVTVSVSVSVTVIVTVSVHPCDMLNNFVSSVKCPVSSV